MWFATIYAFFKCSGVTNGMGEAAFVRWYSEVPNNARTAVLGMTRLKESRIRLPEEGGRFGTYAWHDVIPIGDIMAPVLLQPDPTTKKQRWFYNHFVV